MNLGTCWLIFSRKITLKTLASILTHVQGLHWLFVILTAKGECEFMSFRNPSADMVLCESELDVNLIEKASIFRYGSVSLIDELRRSAHTAALDIAKKSGCILSYDPNVRLLLWPSAEAARGGIVSIWDKAEIIKISEEELKFLIEGCDMLPMINVVFEKLFHSELKLLLVTEGSNGCRYYTQEFQGHVVCVIGAVLRSLASDPDLYKGLLLIFTSFFFLPINFN